MNSKQNMKNTDNSLYIEIGSRLRNERKLLGYTQEQIAEIIGITENHYGKIERGVRSLSLENTIIIYKKLNIDITYLLTGEQRTENSLGRILEKCPEAKKEIFKKVIYDALLLAIEK